MSGKTSAVPSHLISTPSPSTSPPSPFLAGGFTTTLLGFLNFQSWVPIIASFVGATMAWLEFNGTSKKLSRYSDVVHQVNSLILWWERLTDVDRASLANIEQLIMSGEGMFAMVSCAWFGN